MELLQFQPLLKRIRWGGTRLGTVLGKQIGDAADYAESWEIVDHANDQSVVCSGAYKSWPLNRIVNEEGTALFGRHAPQRQFPLLVKYLDATDRLSVQVHPNDRQAREYERPENGKPEAWVIIDADSTSRLYAGLKEGVDRKRLVERLADGSVEECLHSFSVSPGDCVYIPAGTVHAIGEGILLAEIQQSSDLTFRLFDWGRVGANGKPRELHIQEALGCIDFDRGPVGPVEPKVIFTKPHRIEELVQNEFFVMRRHTAESPFTIARDDRFHILMQLSGASQVADGDEQRHFKRGQTLLLPALRADTKIVPAGKMVLLETFLP